MPIYEYRCPTHGQFERRRPVSESALPAKCPSCAAEARRDYTSVQIARPPRKAPTHVADRLDPAITITADRDAENTIGIRIGEGAHAELPSVKMRGVTNPVVNEGGYLRLERPDISRDA